MRPLVSVVVPTHHQPAGLESLLQGLRAQTLGGDRFEVIVVADGSPAGTLSLLEREQACGGLQLQVMEHGAARGLHHLVE